jgi:hypothetical protein
MPEDSCGRVPGTDPVRDYKAEWAKSGRVHEIEPPNLGLASDRVRDFYNFGRAAFWARAIT